MLGIFCPPRVLSSVDVVNMSVMLMERGYEVAGSKLKKSLSASLTQNKKNYLSQSIYS